MFPDTFRKRRQRDILDAQIFLKRDFGVCAVLAATFALIFAIFSFFYLCRYKYPASTQVEKQQTNVIERPTQIIIVEDKPNMCVAWRDVEGCILNGVRRPQRDKNCSDPITQSHFGWCECKDRTQNVFQIEFDCKNVDNSDRHEAFTCSQLCSSRVREGMEKSRKLSLAYVATTKRGETLIEVERRRREEAERRRIVEDAREEAERPIRALIKRGNDLISEAIGDIDSKRLAIALEKLNQAREAYEQAGVVRTSHDGRRWELRELFRKENATDKELALSGAAERLHRAMEDEVEQARRWKESIEAERSRQEAAIREAAEAVEKLQRQELEDLRRKQEDHRLRAALEHAQEEAVELMRSKEQLQEEDRQVHSMTAEQLRQREMRHSGHANESDDDEAIEAHKKYTEFMQRRRRLLGFDPMFEGLPSDLSPVNVQSATEPTGPPPIARSSDISVATATAAIAVSAAVAEHPSADLVVEVHPSADLVVEVRKADHKATSDMDAADSAAKADSIVADSDPALVKALTSAGLVAHLRLLREVGVDSLSDLRFLDDRLIKSLPLPTNHRTSLRRLALHVAGTRR